MVLTAELLVFSCKQQLPHWAIQDITGLHCIINEALDIYKAVAMADFQVGNKESTTWKCSTIPAH